MSSVLIKKSVPVLVVDHLRDAGKKKCRVSVYNTVGPLYNDTHYNSKTLYDAI